MKQEVKTVCVYCASREGTNPNFMESSRQLGKLLAENDLTLVYGGSTVGLMGAVADSALAAGGKVIGIIPQIVIDNNEPKHEGLSEEYMAKAMSDRKDMMEDKSDAFVIMPGGFGTMDEAFQVMILKVLGEHDKPIVIVNIDGAYDCLLNMFDTFLDNGFIDESYNAAYKIVDNVEDIIPILKG